MCTVTPIRIPVRDSDNVIIDRVDPARARCLARAPNATPIYKRATGAARKRGNRGELVGILLADTGDDRMLDAKFGNPRKYTFLDTSDLMPQGVHSLRHLATETAPLYRLAITDCLKKAA